MLRLFVICALVKYVVVFFTPHMHLVKPTLRELSIFPFVVLRDILYYSGITSINLSGMFSSSAVEGGEEAVGGVVEAATAVVADAVEAV